MKIKKLSKSNLKEYLKQKKGLLTQQKHQGIEKGSRDPNLFLAALPIATIIMSGSNQLNAQTVKHGTVDKQMVFSATQVKTVSLSGVTLTFKGTATSGRVDLKTPPNTSHVPNPTNGGFVGRLAYGYLISTGNAIVDPTQDVIANFGETTAWTGQYFGFEKNGRVGWAKLMTLSTPSSTTVTVDAWAHTDGTKIEAGKTTLPVGISVSVENIVTPVTENLKTALTYRFTRTGSTISPLEVNFAITGTAAADDFGIAAGANCIIYDSTAKTGTITIPSGSSTLELLVFPIGDSVVEDDETVIVMVTSP